MKFSDKKVNLNQINYTHTATLYNYGFIILTAAIFPSLHKIPKFHLISWCGNFVERHRFCRISGESPETLRKLFLSITRNLGEISVIYAIDGMDTHIVYNTYVVILCK